MRTDNERKSSDTKLSSQYVRNEDDEAGSGPSLFDPGIRFSAVAVDIVGPVTMVTSNRAKHVLVLTDLFTMYTIVFPLVSTDFADMAREIVENWVLKFGAPNVLHTDQGKNFGGKLIQEMCRLLSIDKTQTSPY